ncbi:uracil-DNA glycosylase [Albibacterium indicum]|uniref:uracil-DNA glycosylase n=1 Tax=Albibacterium indicum TaxID=2292082 RepID=UPI000E4AA9AD|nr:uracil-DNA glycosylase [Pedobacter indicus]
MEKSWEQAVGAELHKPYMNELRSFLKSEYKSKTIFPPAKLIFQAFDKTPFDEIKVVILGQDPYHRRGQAHGLAFSVQKQVEIPPSLRNIYLAIKNDYPDFTIPSHGNLSYWAEQGVLLLNTVLTVREGLAGSHHGNGWEQFTDCVIKTISEKKENVIFLLWGSPAKRKEALINSKKHHVLKSVHPSPLSAYRGFLNCRHFIETNRILIENGRKAIDWQIPT